MNSKFFTQQAYCVSQTFTEKFKGKRCVDDEEENIVSMTLDVQMGCDFQEIMGEDHPMFGFTFVNRQWEDGDGQFSLSVSLNKDEALFIKKQLEFFLEGWCNE